MLFAAGAVVIERFTARRGWRWIRPTYPIVLAINGLVVAPITAFPALPVESVARITVSLGGEASIETETRAVAELPQNFADRFG